MKKEQVEEMANSFLKHHGLYDWKFRWLKNLKSFWRAGQCDYKKKEIALSPKFAEFNYPVLIKQTILHEIAHALRPRHHHNKHWKLTARQLGCVKYADTSTLRCYGKLVKKAPSPENAIY